MTVVFLLKSTLLASGKFYPQQREPLESPSQYSVPLTSETPPFGLPRRSSLGFLVLCITLCFYCTVCVWLLSLKMHLRGVLGSFPLLRSIPLVCLFIHLSGSLSIWNLGLEQVCTFAYIHRRPLHFKYASQEVLSTDSSSLQSPCSPSLPLFRLPSLCMFCSARD